MTNKLYKNLISAKKLLRSKLRKQAGIYKLINLTNNQCYVGSSINLYDRLSQHCNLNANERTLLRCRSRISSALLKYGPENFGLVILKFLENRAELFPTEQSFIDLIQPEYNILSVAGSMRKSIRKEAGERIRKFGPRNISHRKGATHGSDSKALMSENSTKKKAIYHYNADGTFVTSYPSITAAANSTGIRHNRIVDYAKKIPAMLLKENIILSFNKFKNLEDLTNISTIKPKGIKIYCYYPNGILFKIFNSASEAGRSFNIDSRRVKRWAEKNRNKTDLTVLKVCDDKYIFTFEPIN
jgi:hypothetical protein